MFCKYENPSGDPDNLYNLFSLNNCYRHLVSLLHFAQEQQKHAKPSHGPIYDKPECILDAYHDWVSDRVSNLVVIPYISMHGSTERMVNYLVSSLAERDIRVQKFELSSTDLGKLAIALVDAATIVIGTPTVHVGPPIVFSVTQLANALCPIN